VRLADLVVVLVGDADERILIGLVQVAAAEVEPGSGGDFLAVGAATDAVRAFDYRNTPAALTQ